MLRAAEFEGLLLWDEGPKRAALADILRSGAAEVSVFWIDEATGLRCKARPDWLQWINPRRVVRCELNSTVREWLLEQKSRRNFVHFLPLEDYQVTDAMLHEYMLAALGPHLEGCVDRAIALLRDAEAYAKVLAEPPLRDQRWCAQQPWIFGDLGANTVRLLHRTLKVPWPAELSDEDVGAVREANEIANAHTNA